MKAFYLLVTISSLALNVVLLSKLHSLPAPRATSAVSGTHLSPAAEMRNPSAKPVRSVQVRAVNASRPATISWQNIESDDYKDYVANLSQIGCPSETIKDIVTQDLMKHFGIRKWEILRSSVPTDYWSKTFVAGSRIDEQSINALRDLDDRYNANATELLGTEPEKKHELKALDTPEREALAKFGFLEPAKLQRASNALRDLKAELSYLSPDSPKRAELTTATRQMILGIMSDSEREEYEMRTSPVAQRIRQETGDSTPMDKEKFDAEFRRRIASMPE